MNRVTTSAVGALQSVNRIRRSLYHRGVLRSRRLPRPVVSVGNLSMGGSGKTPAIVKLARLLTAAGYRPAILSRGYRRRSPLRWEIVRSDDVSRYGDEPVMMARALPGLPIVVGADRFRSGSDFLQQQDCDLFLLDDGFQHIQLERDCDILILTPSRGLLREGLDTAKDADIVLLRGERLPGDLEAAAFEVRLEPAAFRINGEREPVANLGGRRIVAFAGLADNQQFFQALRDLGFDIAETVEFRDHHRYSERHLEHLSHVARDHHATLVTTEKDWVKIRRNEIGVLEVEMKIERESELLAKVIALAGLGDPSA